jgi:hypothetical protein
MQHRQFSLRAAIAPDHVDRAIAEQALNLARAEPANRQLSVFMVAEGVASN